MEFKIVVSDPDSGRSYQREVKDDQAKKLKGLVLGNEFDGSVVGLDGYKLTITGGSNKSGFPMKKGVHGNTLPKIFMTEGVGYNPVRAERRRKRVRGERIDADIVQINTRISKRGRKSIDELFGISGDEASEASEDEAAGKADDKAEPVVDDKAEPEA